MTIEEFARRIKKLMADIPQPFSNYLAEAIAPKLKPKLKKYLINGLTIIMRVIPQYITAEHMD